MAAPALPEGLARLVRDRQPVRSAPGELCEFCGETVPARHRHVVDLSVRGLLCACPACALLFTNPGAAQGRYRAVPDRYLHDPGLELSVERWNQFQIPVRVAFFLRNSALGRVAAFYPSPGGATESELPIDAWDEVLAGTALARELTPDVEALLISAADDGCSCYLVPIDVCYELVGRVRTRWTGFDGGPQMWREIDEFFAEVSARSRPLPVGGG
jgi:hypothetical protein